LKIIDLKALRKGVYEDYVCVPILERTQANSGIPFPCVYTIV